MTTRNRMEMLYHLLRTQFRYSVSNVFREDLSEDQILPSEYCEWADAIRIEPVMKEGEEKVYDYGVYVRLPVDTPVPTFEALLDELNEEEPLELQVKMAPRGFKLLCTVDHIFNTGLIPRLNGDMDTMLAFLTGFCHTRLQNIGGVILKNSVPRQSDYEVQLAEEYGNPDGVHIILTTRQVSNSGELQAPTTIFEETSRWPHTMLDYLRTVIIKNNSELSKAFIEGAIAGINGTIEEIEQ